MVAGQQWLQNDLSEEVAEGKGNGAYHKAGMQLITRQRKKSKNAKPGPHFHVHGP